MDLSLFRQTESEQYLVDKTGRVYSKFKNKLLKPTKDLNGYITYRLSLGFNKKKTFFAHRLVATAFLKNTDYSLDVNHKNGIKHDNRLENLEWCTRSENMIHARDIIKTLPVGERHFCAKISDTEVDQIRLLYLSGYNVKQIAEKFDLNYMHIRSIICGRRRARGKTSINPIKLIGNRGSTHRCAKLDENDIKNIFLWRADGFMHKEIAKAYLVDTSVITRILNKKTWKHVHEAQ